jgi:hypothetical protein
MFGSKSVFAATAIAAVILAVALSCQSSKFAGRESRNDPSGVSSLEKPASVDGTLWEMLVKELDRSLEFYGADKRTLAAPSGPGGKAVDLSAVEGTGGAMTLSWSYRNTGDYDQNGEVGVADVTPIAINFLKDSASSDWHAARVADGDGSGEIGISDITPIALNFLNLVEGYLIETAPSTDGPFEAVEEVPFGEGQIPGGGGPASTKNWYDGNGDTAGFGIPDGMTGNLTAGETKFNNTCSGCHPAGRDNYTYAQFQNALATQPAMSGLTLTNQEVADVTAYSNRNNADPAPNIFDGSGNTSGFGIPFMTSGNITAGENFFNSTCTGCHAVGDKDNRDYPALETALTIPAMSGLALTAQNRADVVAYLNRNNADQTGPGGGFLLFTHDVAAPVNGNYYRVTPFEGTVPARTLGEPSDPVLYAGGGVALLPPTNVVASDGMSGDRIVITWTKAAGATGYIIYRDFQTSKIAAVGDVAIYEDLEIADEFIHNYWVTSTDGTSESGFGIPDSGFKGPASGLEPVAWVSASDGTRTDGITIDWLKVSLATGYEIYRDSQAAPIATLGDVATYDDAAVTDTQLHTYWLKATNATAASDFSGPETGYVGAAGPKAVTVYAYNDLGMHCMNRDYSEFMILPPYNTLHALVIDRRHGSPEFLNEGIEVTYTIPGNTTSADKTNFWTYCEALLGSAPPPNIGLTGNGLSGTMAYQGSNGRVDWAATGIPITPMSDAGEITPYNLATVTVTEGAEVIGSTKAVVPVSWEISCEICHNTPGISTGTDILRKHDNLHGTDLENNKPVLCGQCHAQAPLGLEGLPGLPSLSHAMHNAHAPRMAMAGLEVDCYACHPGQETQCLRDVHAGAGMDCLDCHGGMTAVADEARTPWVSEPKCGDCHSVAGHEYEEPGKLYRESRGHKGVYCEACHGSPHAITPTINPEDNEQAILLQGHAGTIDTCSLCHSIPPDDPFPHTRFGDD